MEISVIFPFEKDIPDIRDIASAHPFSTYNSSTSRGRSLSAIVAMGLDRAIGFEDDMPWHVPEDLRRFKALTMGHPVIMGRTTWESLPKRPLPGRRNIVISSNSETRRKIEEEGAETASSIREAVAMCPPPEEPFVIGGASVYSRALPMLTRIYVTLIDEVFAQADRFFPSLIRSEWKTIEREGPFVSKSGLRYSFLTLVRRADTNDNENESSDNQ